MALCMEVGLGPGDFVFDGDPSYRQNRGHTHYHAVFGPCLLWPNGWMDEDATWYVSRNRPRRHCIRWGPSSARNGHSSPLSSRTVSIVATVAPLSSDADIIFLPCDLLISIYLSFFFFPRLISTIGDWMSTTLPYMALGRI